MVILGIVLSIGFFTSLAWFGAANYFLRDAKIKLSRLVPGEKLPQIQNYKGIELLRHQHSLVNTSESERLLADAEKALYHWRMRLRLVLIFGILLGLVAALFIR